MELGSPVQDQQVQSHQARTRWRIAINHVLASIKFRNPVSQESSSGIQYIRTYFTELRRLESAMAITKIFRYEIGAEFPITVEAEESAINEYQIQKEAILSKKFNKIWGRNGSVRRVTHENHYVKASIETVNFNNYESEILSPGPQLLMYLFTKDWHQRLRNTPFPQLSGLALSEPEGYGSISLSHPSWNSLREFRSYGEQYNWFESVGTLKTPHITYTIKLAYLNYDHDQSLGSLRGEDTIFLCPCGWVGNNTYFVVSNRAHDSNSAEIRVDVLQWIIEQQPDEPLYAIYFQYLHGISLENSWVEKKIYLVDIFPLSPSNILTCPYGTGVVDYLEDWGGMIPVSSNIDLARAILSNIVVESRNQESFESRWIHFKSKYGFTYAMSLFMMDLSRMKKYIGKWRSGYYILLFVDKILANTEIEFSSLGPVQLSLTSTVQEEYEDELQIEVDGDIISFKYKLPYLTLGSFVFFLILTIIAVVCLLKYTDSSLADIIQATGVLLLSGALGVSSLVHTLRYGGWPLNYALRGRGVARSFDRMRKTIANDYKVFRELIHRETLRSTLSSTGTCFIPHECFGSEVIANWFKLSTAVAAGAELRLTKNGSVCYLAALRSRLGKVESARERKVHITYEDLEDNDRSASIWSFPEPPEVTSIG